MGVTVVVGTSKGAFLLRSDESRVQWTIDGPLFKGWTVTAAERLASGAVILGTASNVYGAAIQKSTDWTSWTQVADGPAYAAESGRKLTEIWRLHAHGDTCYAGVSEAGLFKSVDDGATWMPIDALNDHPTRTRWQPGAGGLCAHAIVVDPRDPRRMWCGISAVGVFRSDDGGDSWIPQNNGVPVILEDQDSPEIGYCVHALAQDRDAPDTLFRQDHRGMFRSRNAGTNWERIENGLPSGFGFPLVIDQHTKHLFAAPLESDEYRLPRDGSLVIYRSVDGGDSWQPSSSGLPQANAYTAVLRGAMDVDGLQPGGVYIGTTSGTVHVSNDGGDSWQTLPCSLPRIQCVKTFVD